jgi:glutathione S-transferase
MRLYIVPGSPNCRKVQAVVHELSTRIETVIVDFATGEHKRPDYLALNPNGLIPALVDGDLRLWESTAIMQYLAEVHGETTLFPRDPARRADVVRWQCWELAHFGQLLGAVLYERLFKPLMGMQGDEAAAVRALEQLRPFAALLDAHLAGRPFVTGSTVTLADYSIAAQLPLANLARIDLAPYPHVRAWVARLDERDAWRAAATPPPMVEALRRATAYPSP